MVRADLLVGNPFDRLPRPGRRIEVRVQDSHRSRPVACQFTHPVTPETAVRGTASLLSASRSTAESARIPSPRIAPSQHA
jgi:hypothetical protein